jgi:hypothetical protein
MLTMCLWSAAIAALLVALNLAASTGRTKGSVFRRSWSGGFAGGLARGVERALLEFQAIEEPARRHSLDERKATRIAEDEQGGPDDPGEWAVRGDPPASKRGSG